MFREIPTAVTGVVNVFAIVNVGRVLAGLPEQRGQRGKEAMVARGQTHFGARVTLTALLTAGAVLFCGTSLSQGQTSSSGMPRVRSLMHAAKDAYAHGDYLTADRMYQQVLAQKQQLTSTEQSDLAGLMRQNTTALKVQQQGRQQLMQAAELLKNGSRRQAQALLRSASANQYLTTQDKQFLRQLSSQTSQGGPAVEVPGAKENSDYQTLLTNAREALSRGDLQTAEILAQEAEKVNSAMLPGWLQPWNDSPAKVLRDVQTSRNKAQSGTDVAQSSGPLKAMRNIFNWRSNSSPQKTDVKPNPVEKTPSTVLPTSFEDGKGNPAGANRTVQARKLIQDGYRALQANDLETARKLALQARSLQPELMAWENSPETLLGEIDRRGSTGSAKAVPAPKTNDPRQLLKMARDEFQKGNLESAESLATRADNVQGTRWGLFEDNPTSLHNDIQQARKARDRKESVQLLAQARKLFEKGNLQQAKELAWQAQKKHGPYDIWDIGDRPQSLLSEIAKAETQQKGNVVPPIPGNTTVQNQELPLQPPGGNAPSGNAMALQKQAQQLLTEARALQRQGNLIEAHAKAMEAKKATIAAQRQGVVFPPDADSADLALLQMNVQAKQIYERMVIDVDRIAAMAGDPQRYAKAEMILSKAKELAVAFGHNVSAIDEKMVALQRVQGKAPTAVEPLDPSLAKNNTPPAVGENNPAPASPLQARGQQMLQDALRELRAGQTQLARKIAEEALSAKYNVQKDAQSIIRMVDAEETRQRFLSAIRNADAVRDAYVRGNYDQARMIAQSVDTKLLPAEKMRSFREILSMPEMQPGAVVAKNNKTEPAPVVGKGNNPIGTATIGDEGPMGIGNGKVADNFAGKYRQMEELLFQKLRQESLAVQTQARQAFEAGDHTSAIELLREYNDKLAQANLPETQARLLKSPVERRLNQYRILQSRIALMKDQRDQQISGKINEGTRIAREASKDQKIAELLKQYRDFYGKREFEKARIIAMQAKELDPDNQAADMALTMAVMARNSKIFNDTETQKADWRIKALDTPFGEPVDVGNPVALDRGAFERSRGRTNLARGIQNIYKTEKEVEIERKLLSPINLNFRNTPLKQAIQDLKDLTGINIIPKTSALEEAAISMDQPLTLEVEQISVKSALNLLLNKMHLTYIIKDEVLQITTEGDAQGKVIRVTYPVADLVVPVQDSMPGGAQTDLVTLMNQPQVGPSYGQNRPYTAPYTLPNAQPVSSFGSQSMADGSGFAVSGSNAGRFGGVGGSQFGTGPGAKQTIEDQLMKLITATIEPESWSDMGGKGQIQYYPLGMGLVVAQTQDIQEQVADLLQALRRLQDLEVAIEIRLISVSESFFEFMGMDFDINITTNNGRFVPQLASGQFQPFGFPNVFKPDGFVSGLTPAGTFTPDLNIPLRSSSFDYTIPQVGGFPGALGADGGLALGLAFLSDIQVFMFLEAAQGDRRANTMQAPRLTVFNGQQASITINDQIPFLTSIAPAQAGAQLYFIPQQIALPVGTSIFVTPVVSADRRFVRLSLTQSMTNLISANVPLIPIQVPITPTLQDGFALPQPQIFQIFLQQPATANIFVQTTVTVPDGGTVLLGGLKTLTETRSEFGPPVLSKIPYISRLFKNVGYGREVTSLMMMVTPRIIINEEEEQIYLEELPPIPRP